MLLLIQGILPSFIFLKTPFLIRLLIIRKNFYLVRQHLRMMFHHATEGKSKHIFKRKSTKNGPQSW